MRKSLWTIVAITLVVCAMAASPVLAQAKSSRPTVAVLDFDFGAIQQWWSGNQDLGKGIADLIVDGLVEDGTYRIIERKKLETLLTEQDFSNSERADPSAKTVAKVGKALGVKYMVVGSVTKFGTEQSNKGINAGAFGGSKYGLGKVGSQKGKANVAVTARLIDTSTGEIMASAKGEGVSSRSGMLLGASGGSGGSGGGGGFEMGSSDYRESILGEATDLAIKQVVAKLVAAKSRLE
jgi:curli biogenesis system outer membrane secretion channel CsgG